MKKINLILVVLLIILVYLLFNKEEPEVITKTNTVIETKYDTIDNTKPQQIKKVYVKISDTIVKNDTITKIVYKDKEVNQYKYTDTLKNGIVKSTIIADKIYKRDISLKTTDTIINTETIRAINKSTLFVGGTITLDKNYKPLNQTLGLFYNRKNKWLGGVGLGYSDGKPNINVAFAIKL